MRGSGIHRREYEKRVNRAIDHIQRHLADELTLAGLARVAVFSPFHFHRVFKAITGETVFGFVQRLRIERAAVALSAHTDASILEVALDHGFASAATFARAFRAHFGMSAAEWRDGGAARWRARRAAARNVSPRNRGKQLRKVGKAGGGGRAETPRRKEE
jgi:AraC family transcriptional regulator